MSTRLIATEVYSHAYNSQTQGPKQAGTVISQTKGPKQAGTVISQTQGPKQAGTVNCYCLYVI